MDNTNSTIPVENFGAYLWDDLIEDFPVSVQERAQELLLEAVTFGDAEWTLVKGSRVDRIFHDAWSYIVDEGEAGTEERRASFARLPSLISPGTLVAVRG